MFLKYNAWRVRCPSENAPVTNLQNAFGSIAAMLPEMWQPCLIYLHVISLVPPVAPIRKARGFLLPVGMGWRRDAATRLMLTHY